MDTKTHSARDLNVNLISFFFIIFSTTRWIWNTQKNHHKIVEVCLKCWIYYLYYLYLYLLKNEKPTQQQQWQQHQEQWKNSWTSFQWMSTSFDKWWVNRCRRELLYTFSSPNAPRVIVDNLLGLDASYEIFSSPKNNGSMTFIRRKLEKNSRSSPTEE